MTAATSTFRSVLRCTVLILAVLTITASAQITPSDDAYISSTAPTTNYGAATSIAVQNPAATGLIRFDLSSIPSSFTSANVSKATLKLYVSAATSPGTFNVVRVTSSWSEKTVTYNTAPTLGAAIASGISVAAANKNKYVEVDITAAVGEWLNGTANDGIALVPGSGASFTIDTKETKTTSHPAELDVVFSGPAGPPGPPGPVSSVGLSAPATDFVVSGSPITSAGTLGLAWNVAPTSTAVANAIVKRDGSGSFSAGAIAASSFSGNGSGLTSINAAQFGGLAPASYALRAAMNAFTANQTILGSTLSMTLGDVGCGGGENGLGSAGLDTSGSLNCDGYSLLGDGKTTFINRPLGGALKFREGNAVNQMVIAAGGNVGIGTSTPSTLLQVVQTQTTYGVPAAEVHGGPSSLGLNVFGGEGLIGGGAALTGFGGAAHNLNSPGGDGIDGTGGDGIGSAKGGTGGAFFGGNSGSNSGGDGIVAIAGSGTPAGLAGNFSGNLDVFGAIFAGTKDFKIDHPLDPANKYLYHASVESSEMMNIYTGNVTTDGQGMAVVELPDWFETLNGDFRYQLTVIGQFAQAIVASEILNHSFGIKTDKPNVKVSWQVTGVRHDAFAKAHPLQVEEEKSERERGFYIYPELYGAPEEKQMEWARHPQTMQRMKEMRNKQSAPTQTASQNSAFAGRTKVDKPLVPPIANAAPAQH